MYKLRINKYSFLAVSLVSAYSALLITAVTFHVSATITSTVYVNSVAIQMPASPTESCDSENSFII